MPDGFLLPLLAIGGIIGGLVFLTQGSSIVTQTDQLTKDLTVPLLVGGAMVAIIIVLYFVLR